MMISKNKRGWSIDGRPFSNEEYKLSEVYRITALSYPQYLNEYNTRFQDDNERDKLLTDHNKRDYGFIMRILSGIGRFVFVFLTSLGKIVAEGGGGVSVSRDARPKVRKQKQKIKKEIKKKEKNPYENFKDFV